MQGRKYVTIKKQLGDQLWDQLWEKHRHLLNDLVCDSIWDLLCPYPWDSLVEKCEEVVGADSD